MKMQQIEHKKNEIFEEEFFKDEECTEAFDFTNAKDLYIELRDGDITPFLELSSNVNNCNICLPFLPKTKYYTLSAISYTLNENKNTLYTISETSKFTDGTFYNSILENIKTITPNLSKYIPEDNAVLFLSKEDCNQYDYNDNLKFRIVCQDSIIPDSWKLLADKSSEITIFLYHGTQSELQKANEVAKELKEKYGVKEVNLFVLHCFVDDIYNYNSSFLDDFYKQNYNDAYNELYGMECKPDMTKNEYKKQFEIDKKNHKQECYINKIITTNSTGILPVQDNERLQVIDSKEIFEEYLKTEIQFNKAKH